MKELYFIRHGQTEWNAIRRMQGQWNSDLNDLGRHQADENGVLLKKQCIDHMIVSPLDRTRQTAEIIDKHLGIGFEFDKRIVEWHCGDWSGEMWADLPAKWPEAFAAWEADRYHYRPPNADNYPDMIERSKPFLNDILTSDFKKIAIVTHGLIGRAMIGSLLSLSPHEIVSYTHANDTVIHLTEFKGQFSVKHYVQGQGPADGLP